MATNFPGSLDNSTSLPYPTSTSDTNSPSLAGGQDNQNDAVIATQTKLGINSSAASTNSVLLGVGSGQSQWGSITGAYTAGSTGSGNFVLATSPTITSPTINTATINNPTLKTDSVIGYTSADNGTLYGMSVSGSVLASAAILGQVNTAAIQTNAVTGPKLATSAILLGYTPITSGVTTTSGSPVQATGLTVTVTVPAGGRSVKVTASCYSINTSSANNTIYMSLWKGTVGSGTKIAEQQAYCTANSQNFPCTLVALDSAPSAGSITYNVGFSTSGGTGSIAAEGGGPAFILAELI